MGRGSERVVKAPERSGARRILSQRTHRLLQLAPAKRLGVLPSLALSEAG